MLPVVRGDRETARQITLYSIALVAVTVVPAFLGTLGTLYGASALVLGALFVWLAVALQRDLTRPRASRLFHYSLLYLALLFVAAAVDVVV
jgi:protoheme IX farnesyltransferase